MEPIKGPTEQKLTSKLLEAAPLALHLLLSELASQWLSQGRLVDCDSFNPSDCRSQNRLVWGTNLVHFIALMRRLDVQL